MKKVIFTIFMTSCLAFSVNAMNIINPSNYSEQIVAESSAPEYTFVGDFNFYLEGENYRQRFKVFESNEVIGGILITTYYARVTKYDHGSTYYDFYKLIPCDYKSGNTTYSYYFSYGAEKYYLAL